MIRNCLLGLALALSAVLRSRTRRNITEDRATGRDMAPVLTIAVVLAVASSARTKMRCVTLAASAATPRPG
jgi:hypothetical protein